MKVFGFAGYSGSGKTTLLEQLIPYFTGRGLRLALIKHAHHDFDIDHAGKDSFRHRQAGAGEVLITSDRRWALMHELRAAPEPDLAAHLARLAPCDLVLVEGFKHAALPKLEIHRAANAKPWLFVQDPYIVAIASDTPAATMLPCFDLNQVEPIGQFILNHLGLQ